MLYKNPNSRWSLSTYAAVAVVALFVALVVASCERDVVPSNNQKGTATKHSTNVEGFVRDPEGKPIPGAVVVLKGSQKGTTTDAKGYFKMSAPAGIDAAVNISFAGYKSVELKFNSKFEFVTFTVSMPPGASTETVTPTSVAQMPSRTGDTLRTIVQASIINGQPVFSVVEKTPEFPGGITAMYEYLSQNMKYPLAATRAGVQGKVFINFVVTTEGEIKDIQILKGLGFGTDEEAVRIVSAMPRWQPGSQDGKPVNVRFNLPINFQLGSKATTGGN
ncbi:TonB family protein [Telluribacter humicola]|uniref:TonB family protein n=1 Tax=Telluribacter humicola TaxID=1720261 RepID=UPI001E33B165|nr:TonB family protein [Telluribacter humicola]